MDILLDIIIISVATVVFILTIVANTAYNKMLRKQNNAKNVDVLKTYNGPSLD